MKSGRREGAPTQRQRAHGLQAGTGLPGVAPPVPGEGLCLPRQHLGPGGLLAEAALTPPAPGSSVPWVSGKEAEQPSRPLCSVSSGFSLRLRG